MTVREPRLELNSLVFFPTTADGGDTVTYSMMVKHVSGGATPSTSNAYDLVLSATVPNTLALINASAKPREMLRRIIQWFWLENYHIISFTYNITLFCDFFLFVSPL